MCNNDDVNDVSVRNTKYVYLHTALYASRGVLEAHCCCWVITRVYVVRAQHSFLSVLFQLSSNSFRCEKKGWKWAARVHSRCVIYVAVTSSIRQYYFKRGKEKWKQWRRKVEWKLRNNLWGEELELQYKSLMTMIVIQCTTTNMLEGKASGWSWGKIASY